MVSERPAIVPELAQLRSVSVVKAPSCQLATLVIACPIPFSEELAWQTTFAPSVAPHTAAEHTQRMAMQEQLVESTVGRVQEMGLLPEQNLAKGPGDTDLGKKSPVGDKAADEQLLPPKPSAVVEIPEALQGVPIPGNPDLKQWTEEDRAKWNAMSPEQKKAWVANRPNVGKIATAEAQKAARQQAWWQD